jgi:hypothetical protein
MDVPPLTFPLLVRPERSRAPDRLPSLVVSTPVPLCLRFCICSALSFLPLPLALELCFCSWLPFALSRRASPESEDSIATADTVMDFREHVAASEEGLEVNISSDRT